jgi:hypothetical protein
MRILFYKVVPLAVLAWPGRALAQPTPADTSTLASQAAALRRPPTSASRLLSGTEYLDYTPGNTIGNQFFLSNLAQRGTIRYDGESFAHVPLRYDLKLDQVIVFDSSRNVNIQLIKERVADFTLGGRSFVRLGPGAQAPAGFYEVLADGNPRLLAHRTKRVAEATVQQHLSFTYREDSRLFLAQGGKLTEITNLKSLLDQLPGQKPALQQYARSNDLQFGAETREAAATLLVGHYHTLAPATAAAHD